jgi:hypothetical protein
MMAGFSMFANISRPDEPQKTYRCPCCHYKTLFGRGGYEICPVCWWEDDGQDDHDADDVRGGPNGALSLTEARKNFASYGASDSRFVSKVREAANDERWSEDMTNP